MSQPDPAGPRPDPGAKAFLTRWCIALAILSVLIGFLLPFFADSPKYP